MKPFLKKLPLILLAIVLLIPLGAAHADAAPPPDFTSLGGLGPFQYQETDVQMVYERVDMELQVVPDPNDSSRIVNQILVNAWFFMHNQGDVEEQMQVIFPLDNIYDCLSEYSYRIAENTFIVSVDGVSATTKKVTTDNPHITQYTPGCDPEKMLWAGFDVTFPTDKEVLIRVSYTMTSDKYQEVERVQYILETGSGWDGPIGRADISFHLPYEIEADNIIEKYMDRDTTIGYQSVYNQLIWSYTGFEPTGDDNIVVAFLSPEIWKEIQSLRIKLQENSQDSDSWLRLLEIYRHIGGPGGYKNPYTYQYYEKIKDGYEQALLANPNNAELNARYAFYIVNDEIGIFPSEAGLARVLPYLNKAFALDGENTIAYDVLSSLRVLYPDFTYTYPPTIAPTITSVPTITLTTTRTATSTLTRTYTPTRTSTSTRTPSPSRMPSRTPPPVPYFAVKISDHYMGTGWMLLFVAGLIVAAGMLIWRFVRKDRRS